MVMYIVIGYVAVILTGIAQVLLKKGSSRQGSLLSMYLNFFTLAGYIILFGVTLMNLYIYRYLDVKYGVILLPFTFIVVNLLSFFILKERLSKMQLTGSGIIVLGVAIFNL